MSWLTLILLGLVAFLLYMVFNQPDARGMPPGPRGLPLVGNLFDLLWEDSIRFFGRLADEYGPLYSVQLGLRRVVVLNSSHWLTQAFVRQGDMFNHRPRGTVLSFIMGGKEKGRPALQPALRPGHFRPQHRVAHVRRRAVPDGRQEPPLDRRLPGDVLTLVEQGGFLNYTPMIQFIGTFLKPKAFKVGYNVKHRLDYFQKLIDEHKANLDNPDRNFDLMYQYLLEQRRQIEQGNADTIFTDNQLKWLVSDLFIVGLDTTVTTLRWCTLFLVLRHPEVQEKIFQEWTRSSAPTACLQQVGISQ
ncbi:putative cytochrome P450 2C8-like [Penaeus vannamei]|uniref:Putative cytochrome P450 2C8-like n=1 Tax=Penaeus vannamei TaxID=6689 RepID=A0A423T371_PENVA|nr:putative cytochrome P450 2C8-like [Penaeus vannamei]